jgi:hypothetical protein
VQAQPRPAQRLKPAVALAYPVLIAVSVSVKPPLAALV